MINKEEMLALVRSVSVPTDVEEGMGHAFDLGVDWERESVVRLLNELCDSYETADKQGSAQDIRRLIQHIRARGQA